VGRGAAALSAGKMPPGEVDPAASSILVR
jgi:hypothetical protein